MTNPSRAAPALVSRIAASLLGGYAFVWGFVSLGISVLVAAGMPYEEAQTLLFLLAFLIFLAAFCWAYAADSVRRVWLVLGGSAAAMTAAAWLLARALV
jgi:hypothetical protein